MTAILSRGRWVKRQLNVFIWSYGTSCPMRYVREFDYGVYCSFKPWWRHQMETISALPTPLCAESPSQRPVRWSFDVFFDPRLNKRLSKQSWGWWFETPSCPLWRHCNAMQGCFTANSWDHVSSDKKHSQAKLCAKCVRHIVAVGHTCMKRW